MDVRAAMKAAKILVIPAAASLAGCAENMTVGFDGSPSHGSYSNSFRSNECFYIRDGQEGVKFNLGNTTYWVRSNGVVGDTASLFMHGEKSTFGLRTSNLTTVFDVDASVGPHGSFAHADGRKTSISPNVDAREIDYAAKIAWNELSHMRAGAPVSICPGSEGFYGSGYGYARVGGGMEIPGVNEGPDNLGAYGHYSVRPHTYTTLNYSLTY